jgi:signal transduction histidine kinase
MDRLMRMSASDLRPPSTIRGALVAGFAVVFAVWVFAGYELIRRLHDVELQVAARHQSLMRGSDTLSEIRSNVLLGSLYLRDALIDPGPVAQEYYKEVVRQLRSEIDERLPAYLLEPRLPPEREEWGKLQTSLGEYWALVEFVFSPDLPTNVAQANSLLQRDVLPARTNVLKLLDSLRALQDLSQQAHDVEVALLYREARTRFLAIVSGALLLGVGVAWFAFRRVGGLEAEIHRQRIAETHNRHDLERLSARLVDAQEQERRSLARELHDEVGQALTAIKMGVGVALRAAEPDSRARASLEEARAIAETTLEGVRDLSQLLHPSMLDDFGLPETLAAYLRSFSKRTGIRAQLTHEGLEGRLPPDAEVCVYRIVQEALTNVARHSGAIACSVAVARQGDTVTLVIEDQGRGITGAADRLADARRGLGLIGMRERAQALAGRFSIENRPEGGTRVSVVLPVPHVDAAAERMAG